MSELASTIVTVENPAAAAEASAEQAARAAEDAASAARLLEAQVIANAAKTVAEVKNDLAQNESDISWLRQEVTATQTAIKELATMTASSLALVTEQILTLQNLLTPPAPLVEETPIVESPQESADAQRDQPIKSPAQQKRRTLI